MSPKNRGDRIQLLHKVVTKHFSPVAAANDRSVLEHLVYACCLEDAPYDAADEAFHRLQESYFDWNEVRVTTVSELCETLHNLPEPSTAALRIKKNLQSIFETRYSFDLDDMIKMNQGKAVQELEKLSGMTKFVLGYVTQNALGGHSIPVSNSIMKILLATEIVTETEAEKGLAPGLERTVPKTKGAAFGSCLHQFAVTAAASPGAKQTKALLKEAGASESKAKAEPATETRSSKKKTSTKQQTTSKPQSSDKASGEPETAKKTAAKKGTTKKAVAKSSTKDATAKKSPSKKLTKRKPR